MLASAPALACDNEDCVALTGFKQFSVVAGQQYAVRALCKPGGNDGLTWLDVLDGAAPVPPTGPRIGYTTQCWNGRMGLTFKAARSTKLIYARSYSSIYYDAKLHWDKDCAPDATTTCSVSLGVPTSGRGTWMGDVDWFKINLPVGQPAKIAATADKGCNVGASIVQPGEFDRFVVAQSWPAGCNYTILLQLQ